MELKQLPAPDDGEWWCVEMHRGGARVETNSWFADDFARSRPPPGARKRKAELIQENKELADKVKALEEKLRQHEEEKPASKRAKTQQTVLCRLCHSERWLTLTTACCGNHVCLCILVYLAGSIRARRLRNKYEIEIKKLSCPGCAKHTLSYNLTTSFSVDTADRFRLLGCPSEVQCPFCDAANGRGEPATVLRHIVEYRCKGIRLACPLRDNNDNAGACAGLSYQIVKDNNGVTDDVLKDAFLDHLADDCTSRCTCGYHCKTILTPPQLARHLQAHVAIGDTVDRMRDSLGLVLDNVTASLAESAHMAAVQQKIIELAALARRMVEDNNKLITTSEAKRSAEAAAREGAIRLPDSSADDEAKEFERIQADFLRSAEAAAKIEAERKAKIDAERKAAGAGSGSGSQLNPVEIDDFDGDDDVFAAPPEEPPGNMLGLGGGV